MYGGIQWSWVQIVLRPIFYSYFENPSVVNTKKSAIRFYFDFKNIFLDVTFNLLGGTYKLYMKPNDQLFNSIKVRVSFENNIEKKHLCRHGKNYYYFCK